MVTLLTKEEILATLTGKTNLTTHGERDKEHLYSCCFCIVGVGENMVTDLDSWLKSQKYA